MESNNKVTYSPKVVYNMSANFSGVIVELLDPLGKNKYGDIFKEPLWDYVGDNTDVVSRLIAVGVSADAIEVNKLSISKDGVNMEIELIDGYTKVNNISNQIAFLLKEIKLEREKTIKEIMKHIVDRNQYTNIIIQGLK